METRIVIPKDRREPAIINGVKTNEVDFIIRSLNHIIGEYIDFKCGIEPNKDYGKDSKGI